MFRRSSGMFKVDDETRDKIAHRLSAGSPAHAAMSSPAVKSGDKRFSEMLSFKLDEPKDSGSDGFSDDSDSEEMEYNPSSSVQVFARRGGKKRPTASVEVVRHDAQMVELLAQQVTDAAFSDWGLRLFKVAKAFKTEVMGNYHPWNKFTGASYMKARRLMYDTETDSWDAEPVLVQLGEKPFDRGAFRECFKMKQIKGQELERLYRTGEIPAFEAAMAFARCGRTCWVAKRYLDSASYSLHKQDVAMQMVAKSYAEAFARARLTKRSETGVPQAWKDAAKPVDFLMSHLIELDSSAAFDDTPTFSVEAFVYGMFDKYNSNSGMVAGCRKTPQAFSHFSFEHSQRSLICVDVQGVDDLYTDPAVHAPSKFLWCDANLGFRGMALFFWSHRCNDACRLLKLHAFPTYAEGVEANKVQHNMTVSEVAHGVLAKSESELQAVRDDANAKENRTKLEPLLSWPGLNHWCGIPHPHHPQKLSKAMPPELIEPCVHMELCWMYASGRLSETGAAEGALSPDGAIYHLQLAARGGLICALLALARLCSDFPHQEFLPMVVGTSVHLCLRLLECAAHGGCKDAAASLAALLEQGVYDDPDLAKAAEFYEQYANLELNPPAEETKIELALPELELPERKDSNPVDDGQIACEPCDSNLSGVARPTAWGNCFGWDNHGLTPHGALASAAKIHETGADGLKPSAKKAAELYRWASEVAMEAGRMKAAMQYEARADELEGEEEEEEEDKCPQCGNIYMDDAVFCRKCGTKRKDKTNPEEGFQRQISNETTASLERLDINVPVMMAQRLEQLGKELGKDDLCSVVEHLLNSYQQQKSSNANNPRRASAEPTTGDGKPMPRSILKKPQFAKPVVEQVIMPGDFESKMEEQGGMVKMEAGEESSEAKPTVEEGSSFGEDSEDSDVEGGMAMTAVSSLCHRVKPRIATPAGGFLDASHEAQPQTRDSASASASANKSPFGQNIRVEVVDSSGKPVEGASVRLVGTKNVSSAVKTDNGGGACVQRSLQVALKVEKSGYATYTRVIPNRLGDAH